MTTTELALLDRWQRQFPLQPRPFAEVAQREGMDEASVMTMFGKFLAAKVISRIGAVVRPHTAGASTLAAIKVPPERMDAVAARVNDEPTVNHNYEREGSYNLWFVVTAADRDAVEESLTRIEANTGLGVLSLPLVEAYHLDLGFPLFGTRWRERPGVKPATAPVQDEDRPILAAMEDGLPLSPRPYRDVGLACGLSEEEVIARLQDMVRRGIITRMGCIVSHRALGYRANAMCVWDVPDIIASHVAQRMMRVSNVTLCYRRQRRLPDWPYNMFCMVHAKSREEAQASLRDINAVADAEHFDQAVLFSTRCFKQRGARFSDRRARLS